MKRGNPDGDEVVHLRKTEAKREYPLCQTGAYNIRWTDFANRVTCPKCKERMKS